MNILTYGILTVVVLAVGLLMVSNGCRSANDVPGEQPNDHENVQRPPKRDIGDFPPLKEGLTEAELIRCVGEPDRVGGSGLPWLVYALDQNQELWVVFTGPWSSDGRTRALSGAIIMEVHNGRITREKVIYEIQPTTRPKGEWFVPP